MRATALPLAGDVEVLLAESQMAFIERLEGRRVLSAYACRVKGRKLWILYRPLGQHVELVVLTKVEPRAQA